METKAKIDASEEDCHQPIRPSRQRGKACVYPCELAERIDINT